MKRILTAALFGLGAIALFGCPVFSDSSRCGDFGNNCGPSQCSSDFDCPSNATCDANHQCVTTTPPNGSCRGPADCGTGQNCGSDNQCHAGDCSNSGCPNGLTCKLSGGTLQCVGGADGGTGDSGNDGSIFTGCTSDASCSSLGAGAKCLDGQCVAPANQCSDATQCPNSEACVQGVCTPTCDATHACPTGYSCDSRTGVCTGNTNPCGGDGGTCTSPNTTCVDQHCVTDCGPGNTCPTGLICVDNGCIPDQVPQFVCNTEGVQDACASGSICLHHNCYIGCDIDAGTNACKTADKFNVCKQVTTGTGTYSVCGSSSNLGGQCDPTRGSNCASPAICIDGYCR